MIRRHAITVAVAATALTLALAPLSGAEAAGPPEGKGKPAHAGGPPPGKGGADRESTDADLSDGLDAGDAVTIDGAILAGILTGEERTIIRDYFATTPRDSLPPGLAKRETLPPGLARQVERTGTLPPGLSGQRLPDDLQRRLPDRGPETERVIVGDDVVLVEAGTRLILDILENVLSQ